MPCAMPRWTNLAVSVNSFSEGECCSKKTDEEGHDIMISIRYFEQPLCTKMTEKLSSVKKFLMLIFFDKIDCKRSEDNH